MAGYWGNSRTSSLGLQDHQLLEVLQLGLLVA